MRIAIIFAALFMTSVMGLSQASRLDKAEKLLTKGKVDQAEIQLMKAEDHDDTKGSARLLALKNKIAFARIPFRTPEMKGLSAVMEFSKSTQGLREVVQEGEHTRGLAVRVGQVSRYTHMIGGTYFMEGKYDSAMQVYQLCSDLAEHLGVKDTMALLNRAMCADKMENVKAATDLYRQCIEMGYRAQDAFSFLLGMYQRQQMKDEFSSTYFEARMRFPRSFEIFAYQVNPLIMSEDYSSAIELMESQAFVFQGNSSFQYTLGSLYHHSAEIENASRCYLSALSIDPTHFEANYNYGAIVFNEAVDLNSSQENQDLEKAQKLFRKALPYLEAAHQAHPEDRNTMASLQAIYAQLNQADDYMRIKRMMGEE